MKPAGPTLLYLIMAGSLAAQPVATAPPAKTSARLTQEIRRSLPKYEPPATTAPAAAPATPRDPDVMELPKIVVQEKRLPGNDPDAFLTGRSIQQKAMVAYKVSMTDLEWALNSWFIPLVSPPASARARQYYESHKLADKINRLNSLIKTIGLTDPKEAAKLRQAMDPRKLPKDD